MHKRLPSGQDVCAARLTGLIEAVKQIDPGDGRLDPFMPAIHKQLGEMSRDDVIKRFVLKDFDKMLAYYKTAPDLNAAAGQGGYPVGDRRDPGVRRDQGGRRDQRDRRDQGERRPGAEHGRDEADADVVQLRINLGRRNSLTPPDLITLINRATPGPMLRVGRIHITESASFFEMMRPDAERILPALNRTTVGPRAVRVVMEDRAPERRERPERHRER